MTREEILNKQAGPEMDFLVAKYYGISGAPSTDIVAAWHVVEMFAHTSRNKLAKEFNFSHFWIHAYPDGSWHCSLNYNNAGVVGCYAPSAPLAICRAALLAVMGDDND